MALLCSCVFPNMRGFVVQALSWLTCSFLCFFHECVNHISGEQCAPAIRKRMIYLQFVVVVVVVVVNRVYSMCTVCIVCTVIMYSL